MLDLFFNVSGYLEDRYLWPKSGYEVLDQIVNYRRQGIGLSERCYAGKHPSNLLMIHDSSKYEDELEKCIVSLQPVTDYFEFFPEATVMRIYRAERSAYTCELTAPYVRYNARSVGSDCGLALFPNDTPTEIGELSNVNGG
jgi:hypothetical protein